MTQKTETLFALAQAERLGGHCPSAIKHYKLVLEKMSDLETSKLIQGNVALCERTEGASGGETKPKTEVRVERKTDVVAVTSCAVGALAIGSGVGLFVASGSTRDAAAGAKTLDDNRALNARADLERGLSYGALGLGVGLVGFAVYRWVTADKEEPATGVTVSHAAGATTLSLVGRF